MPARKTEERMNKQMQKCMEKLNANAVGVAAHSDPLNQNGITLIALIITIIVMLILVGVTINVALNGGLFEKAEQAAIGTEKQSIYEQIVSHMELTNDGKISVKGTFDNVIAEFGADKVINITPATVDENTTEVTFNVIGKTGTYNYKISGKNIEKNPVETPESPTLPSENEGVQLLKIYRDQDISLVFFENQVFVTDRIGNVFSYMYNEEEKTITIDTPMGTLAATLSEDGKSITAYIIDKDYSFSMVEGNTEVLYVNGTEIYEGVYYNAAEQKYACVIKDSTYDEHGEFSIWCENEGYITSRSNGPSIDITNDGKTIQYNGSFDGERLEYILLEAGEF